VICRKLFFFGEITILLRSTPIRTLSFAISKSYIVTTVLFRLAHKVLLHCIYLQYQPPDNPGVERANVSKSTSLESGSFRVCTLKISFLPLTPGKSTSIAYQICPDAIKQVEHISAVSLQP
jgi:hypothetical protein